MHPDMVALHTAVNALLKANKAVVRASSASDRAGLRGFRTTLLMCDSPISLETGTLHRAQGKQRDAAEQIDEAWVKLESSFSPV